MKFEALLMILAIAANAQEVTRYVFFGEGTGFYPIPDQELVFGWDWAPALSLLPEGHFVIWSPEASDRLLFKDEHEQVFIGSSHAAAERVPTLTIAGTPLVAQTVARLESGPRFAGEASLGPVFVGMDSARAAWVERVGLRLHHAGEWFGYVLEPVLALDPLRFESFAGGTLLWPPFGLSLGLRSRDSAPPTATSGLHAVFPALAAGVSVTLTEAGAESASVELRLGSVQTFGVEGSLSTVVDAQGLDVAGLRLRHAAHSDWGYAIGAESSRTSIGGWFLADWKGAGAFLLRGDALWDDGMSFSLRLGFGQANVSLEGAARVGAVSTLLFEVRMLW